jgi:hypothetical protein
VSLFRDGVTKRSPYIRPRRALALRALDARLATAPTSSLAAQDAAAPLKETAEASAVDVSVGDAVGVADLKAEPAAFKEGGAAAKE